MLDRIGRCRFLLKLNFPGFRSSGLKIMGPNWHPSVASASLNALAGPPIWYCGSQALSETRQAEQSRNTPQTNSLETRFVEQRETKLKHEVGDLTDEVGMFGRGTHTMRAGMPPCKECGGQGRTKKCLSPSLKEEEYEVIEKSLV